MENFKKLIKEALTPDYLKEEFITPNEIGDEAIEKESASDAYESKDYKNESHDCETAHPDQSHGEWEKESVNEGYDLSNNEIAVLERLIMMIRKGDNLSTNQNIQKVAIPLLRKIMRGYERTDSVSSKFSEPLGEDLINEEDLYDSYAEVMYGDKWDNLDRDKQSEVVDAVEGSYSLDQIRPVDEGKDWIQKAIKRPGALHRELGVPKDKDIPKSLINKTIARLRKKDKDDEEEGTQLGAADERELRQLNLAKTLSKFNENKLAERVIKRLRESK